MGAPGGGQAGSRDRERPPTPGRSWRPARSANIFRESYLVILFPFILSFIYFNMYSNLSQGPKQNFKMGGGDSRAARTRTRAVRVYPLARPHPGARSLPRRPPGSAGFLRALRPVLGAARHLESSLEHRERERKKKNILGEVISFLNLGPSSSIQNAGVFQGGWETRGEFCCSCGCFCPSNTP